MGPMEQGNTTPGRQEISCSCSIFTRCSYSLRRARPHFLALTFLLPSVLSPCCDRAINTCVVRVGRAFSCLWDLVLGCSVAAVMRRATSEDSPSVLETLVVQLFSRHLHAYECEVNFVVPLTFSAGQELRSLRYACRLPAENIYVCARMR